MFTEQTRMRWKEIKKIDQRLEALNKTLDGGPTSRMITDAWLVAIPAIIGIATLIIILLCSTAYAGEIPKERAVNAIIGEAEGEGYQGKLAVACSLRIRGDLRGVYGEHSKRVIGRLYNDRTYKSAKLAWEESSHAKNCEFVHGATHWEGTAFKKPYWVKGMLLVATIGNQNFYREIDDIQMMDIDTGNMLGNFKK